MTAALVATAIAGAAVVAYGARAVEQPEPPMLAASEVQGGDSPAGGHMESADPKPQGEAPVAVFIGDSYTTGQNTPLEGVGFTERLAELRGWEPVNLAVSGTGYAKSHDLSWCPAGGCVAYPGVIADALAADPDVVVVSGGRNDAGLDLRIVGPAIDRFYHDLRSAFPTEEIIVTSPIWSDGPPPPELEPIQERVERAAARIGAQHVDLGGLFRHRPELITDDGIHPTADGLLLMADRIDARLDALAAAD